MKIPTGMQLIKAERRRQITKEKWTSKHDDTHEDSSLLAAARCYERCAIFQERHGKFPRELTEAFTVRPLCWPWELHSFKLGRSVIRTLSKAGALYQAEVDRIGRIQRKAGPGAEPQWPGPLRGAQEGVARVAQSIDRLLG